MRLAQEQLEAMSEEERRKLMDPDVTRALKAREERQAIAGGTNRKARRKAAALARKLQK